MAEERRDGVCEIKFPVQPETVPRVLEWMRAELAPDPHGTGVEADSYLVQSLYLDTPDFDVFHRRGSSGRAKFRIRRYGDAPELFLERKLKRGGVVRKRRVSVGPGDLERLVVVANGATWGGAWFHHRLSLRGLRPVILMNYRRVARQGVEAQGRFRVTLDRELRAMRADRFRAPEGIEGGDLLRGTGVLEVKFASAVPAVVKRFLEQTGLVAGPLSKYRLGVRSCGLVAEPEPVLLAGKEL